MTDTCPATGKRIYTRKEAKQVAGRWRHNHFARMSHYRCNKCKGWHIGNNSRKPMRRR